MSKEDFAKEKPKGKIVDRMAETTTQAAMSTEQPEPRPEPAESTPVESSPGIDQQRLTLVSEGDAYIADRMRSQPKTLSEVAMVQPKKYSPSEHRLSLPTELKEYEEEFSFRWINKKKRAIDDAIDVKGWVIVNRALFPKLPKHLFTTSGAVERGDSILTFMSKASSQGIKDANRTKARALRESNPMLSKKPLPEVESGAGFYKPQNTSAETAKEDKDGSTIGEGMQEGRDF